MSGAIQVPVRNDWSKRCRNVVDVAKMSVSAPLLGLSRRNRGAEINTRGTSTSFRHLFDKSFFTGMATLTNRLAFLVFSKININAFCTYEYCSSSSDMIKGG